MNLLMIGGDRSVLRGKKGAFWYTLDALRQHWDRIDVLCPRKPRATSRKHQAPSTKHQDGHRPFPTVFFHPSPRGLWYQPWWIAREGRRIVDAHHTHVCTVHAYPPFHHVPGALLLRRKTGIPVLLEVHGLVGSPRAASLIDFLGRMLSRFLLPQIARRADGVRVINTTLKQQLVAWKVPEEKITVVPSFYCDRAVWHPDASAEKRYDFVFCARLDRNKGLRSVLQALASVPHATLLVIGDGADRKHCEELSRRLGTEDRVTFAGWIAEQREVAALYRQGCVFLQNARSEGGPRTALEAMACGLPVISTCVGVMPDVLRDGENGCFTTGEPEDLAEKMHNLLSDHDRLRRMGAAAARAVEGCEREGLIAQYTHFLQSLR